MLRDPGPAMTAVALGIIGGLINRFSTKRKKPFSIIELIGEFTTCGFVCLVVFLLLTGLGQPQELSIALAGLCGHMATRTLFLIERAVASRLEKLTPAEDPPAPVTSKEH